MLGCVSLGQSQGCIQMRRCCYCGSKAVQLSFSILVCAYFPELQRWEEVAEKLPPASGMVQVADGVVL